MNKNNLKYYIGNVILFNYLFLMGICGDKFIKVIILLMTSIISVMENYYLSIRKQGIIK